MNADLFCFLCKRFYPDDGSVFIAGSVHDPSANICEYCIDDGTLALQEHRVAQRARFDNVIVFPRAGSERPGAA